MAALACVVIADLALAARLILAAVFAVAGIAKLLDRDGARRAVAGLGVPRPLVAWVAVLLPIAELAVAAALVDTRTAIAGAVGAAALLAVFVAAISIALARGKQPDCRCFGQLDATAVGRTTVIRDVGLAAIAVFAATEGPGTGVAAWAAGVSAVGWATILVAIVLVVAFVVEGSQLVERWRRRSQVRHGDAAPFSPKQGGE